MDKDTLFAGLNDIPWAQLTHAYGTAEDVPRWLRQLTSADAKVRKAALDNLYGSICHQNWICPATGYAVPFVIRLLAAPEVQGKDAILDMLADIVASADTLDERAWRANSRVPQWNVPAHIPFKDARAEAATSISTYVSLLEDADPKVRMQAAHVLAGFDDRAGELRAVLVATIQREQDTKVRANHILALSQLSRAEPEQVALFERVLDEGENVLLRFSAALALAGLMREQTPQAAAELLAQVLLGEREIPNDFESLAGGRGAPWNAASWALYELGSKQLQFAAPRVIAVLRDDASARSPELVPYMHEWHMERLARLLLFIVLGKPPKTPQARSVADLSPNVWEALAVILGNPAVWHSYDFQTILRAYGLPNTRGAMGAYLGREVVPEPPRRQTRVHQDEGPLDRYRTAIERACPVVRVRMMQGRVAPPSQNNDVITVNDTLIFRFPKHQRAIDEMESELRLLRALQGKLPLPIPDPIYSSLEPREVGQAFMGYVRLPGKPLYREMLESVPDEATVQRIAQQLGSFLHALHTLPVAEVFDFPLPIVSERETWARMYADVREKLFPSMRPDAREAVARHFEEYLDQAGAFAYTPTLIHGDFGASNILYDAKAHRVRGIIDWSSAGLGDPAVDLAALICPATYGEEFAARLTGVYPSHPGVAELLPRARFYIGTFALQEALFGVEVGDEQALRRGLEEYV